MRRAAQPWKVNRSRVLRANQPSAEERMWECLRAKRLNGLKFVRQLPIAPYYADFARRSLQLIVEIDGGTHSTDEELRKDAIRSRYLERRGWRLFRTDNDEIYENLDGVADTLLAFIRGDPI